MWFNFLATKWLVQRHNIDFHIGYNVTNLTELATKCVYSSNKTNTNIWISQNIIPKVSIKRCNIYENIALVSNNA